MINRTKVNASQVSAANPSKSGFNLSYNCYNDYMLGRAHVSGHQQVMPATKFSGHNKGDFMFHLVGTEFVAPIDATQFNVAVSLRSIDNTFEDAFAPSKNNSMSANWRTPTFKLSDKVKDLLYALDIIDANGDWVTPFATFMTTSVTSESTLVSSLSGYNSFLTALAQIEFTVAAKQLFEEHYMSDIVEDYYAYIKNGLSGIGASTPVLHARYAFFDAILTPFFGESSLMDEFGYIILRKEDLKFLFIGTPRGQITGTDAFADVAALQAFVDSTPQCEYNLRAYYAMWYQLLRDPNLEPVSSTLPKWKQFGSSSVVTLPFFLHRCRSWYDDMYVGAQPDDMSRHVFAPVFNNSDVGDSQQSYGSNVKYLDADYDNEFAQGQAYDFVNQHNISSVKLTWRDSLTGTTRFIDAPLPAQVRDSIVSSFSASDSFGLDLYNLRQAQSLERYLKRNFYFGDEYKERMLAHYGSEISDYRLNYPTLLSTSINAANQDRLVNNTATAQAVAGTRSTNMTIQSSGDGFESFAEEFTIVINLISFMPRPQYSGVNPFNLLYRQSDYPLPEFAANNEELSRVAEIACSGLAKNLSSDELGKFTFGHHPYAHIWRSRVDEAHGIFRSSKSACLFTRYFSVDDGDSTTFPKLNYWFIHCRPSLNMFLNTLRLDCQLDGNVSHDFYIETPLPVPVESI